MYKDVFLIVIWIVSVAAKIIASFFMSKGTERLLPITKKGRVRKYFPAILFWIMIGMPTWVGDENPLFILPMVIAVFLFCFEGERLAKITVGIVIYISITSINMILDSSGFWDGIEAEIFGVAGNFLKAFVYMLFWFMLTKIVPEGKPLSLSRRLWGLVLVLSAAPMFAVLTFSIWDVFSQSLGFWTDVIYGSYGRKIQMLIAYTIVPFALISSLGLLAAMVVLSRQGELEEKHRMGVLREVYYEGIRREQGQVRALRHDMNNHIAALQGMLIQGNAEKARMYLEQLSENRALTGSRLNVCENEAANIVISAKLEIIEQRGMRDDFLAALPMDLPVSDVDLCSLIGNALDNAIEGADKAENKTITMRARADKGMLMLQVVNYIGEELICEKGQFLTTKKDSRSHGFGLAGMRSIAESYGGTMEVSAANGKFELIICIPMHQKQES